MKELKNELLEAKEVTVEGTVTIPVARYEELIKKEFVYDIKKIDVSKSKYADRVERALFGIEEKEGEE